MRVGRCFLAGGFPPAPPGARRSPCNCHPHQARYWSAAVVLGKKRPQHHRTIRGASPPCSPRFRRYLGTRAKRRAHPEIPATNKQNLSRYARDKEKPPWRKLRGITTLKKKADSCLWPARLAGCPAGALRAPGGAFGLLAGEISLKNISNFDII